MEISESDADYLKQLLNSQTVSCLEMENLLYTVCESDILEPKSFISDIVFVQPEDIKFSDEYNRPNVSMPVENIHSINVPVESEVPVSDPSYLSVDSQEINKLPYIDVPSAGLIEPEEIPVSHEVAVCEKTGLIVSNVDQSDSDEQLCIMKSLNLDNLNQENFAVDEVPVKLNVSNNSAPHIDSSVLPEVCEPDSVSAKKSQKRNDETSVRRSTRIRSIAEKKKKCAASVKTTEKKVTNGCQYFDPKNQKLMICEVAIFSDANISGKSKLNIEPVKKNLPKNELLPPSRGRGRPKGKKSEKPKAKKKSDAVEARFSKNNNSSSLNSCKIETGISRNGAINKRGVSKKANSTAATDTSLGVKPGASTGLSKKHNYPITTELSIKLSNVPLDTILSSQGVYLSAEKYQFDENNRMKPEKVKSRWRRSSELEHGELSGSDKSVLDAKTPVCSGSKESLTLTSSASKSVASEEKVSANETKVKPPQFEPIAENIYRFERKKSKTKKEVRRMLCDCTLTKDDLDRGIQGCDEDCLNRLLMIECGSRCATGEHCSNRRFQKKSYVSTAPFKTEKKGWGLKVQEDVDAGSFVIEYVGEVLSRHEFKQRVKQYSREKCSHYYFMALKSDEIIDATYKGNVSRFINHSCNPNCETQKWTVNGELRIGFFTTQDMKAGEELTFDYKFQRYGREAQRCHCESENCTGYIGESKPLALESIPHKVSVKRKKSAEEKKKAVFEDLIFDEELEKLCSNGGLRNREQTLILARLMVRAEDVISRLRLLDVILKTNEGACLRLFLDYHGLSLIWSWMADVNEVDSFKLKSRILQVLSILPIPNKTVLLDSKVMNLVQKWSVELPQNKASDSLESGKANESKLLVCEEPTVSAEVHINEPVSKKNKLNDALHLYNDTKKDSLEKKASLSDICDKKGSKVLEPLKTSNNPLQSVATKDASLPLKTAKTNGVSKSDDESIDTVEEEDEKRSDVELTSMAAKLLQSWSSLTEVFRIPRLEQQKRRADELEADGDKMKYTHGRDRLSENAESVPQAKTNIESKEINVFGKSFNENFNERKYMKIQVCVTEDCSRPRKTFNPTPRMTKHERRQLFAMEVQNRERDQEAMRKHDEPIMLVSENSFEYSQTHTAYYCSESDSYIDSQGIQSSTYPNSSPVLNFPSDGLPAVHQPPKRTLLATPGFPENVTISVPTPQYPDASSRVPFPPPAMMFNTPPPQFPFLGVPPPSLSQPPPPLLPPRTNYPGPNNVLGIASVPTVSPLQPQAPSAVRLAPPSVALPPQNIPVSVASSSCIARAPMVPTQPPPPITSLPPPRLAFPGQSSIPSSTAVGPSYLTNAPPFVGTQNRSLYYPYTQSSSSSNANAEQLTPEQHLTSAIAQAIPKKPIKLPPNWKTAIDPEGTIYYYHVITRQTQWDPPEYNEFSDELDSPTYDEPKVKRKSTTTAAAADTSFAIEVAKKIKELFRTKMSSFVVQCLNAYRKPECTAGRIQSTEDFKYLARKLTHFVMAKELKHCKNVEELECNENVKQKAKDFIVKYMSKFGPCYSKEKAPSV